MTFPLPGANWTYLRTLRLVATTGASGFALQNGTPTIFTWTAPNDGKPHRFMLVGNQNVSSATTGGQVSVTFTRADGSGQNTAPIFGGTAAAGYHAIGDNTAMVAPGTTVTVAQSSAMTAGTASIWVELWAL